MPESIVELNAQIDRLKAKNKDKLFYVDVWEKKLPETEPAIWITEWHSGHISKRKKLTKAENERI